MKTHNSKVGKSLQVFDCFQEISWLAKKVRIAQTVFNSERKKSEIKMKKGKEWINISG